MRAWISLAASEFDLYVLDVAVKSTVILGIAALVVGALSLARSSAATRHLAWTLAVGSVLLLPVFAALPTPWSFSWNGNWSSLLPTGAMESTFADLGKSGAQMAFMPGEEMTSAMLLEPALEQSAVVATPRIGPGTNDPGMGKAASRIRWIYAVWAIGFLTGLAPVCLGMASLRWLRRCSQLVTEGPLFDAFQEAIGQLRLTRKVLLLQSESRSMPMTWGIWRPAVLLPAEASMWNADRLRVVLLHELAHVQRHDCLTQFVSQMARATYWFNPLVWVAERRLRVEQERACDDRVLNCGWRASDYAEHLMDVLTRFRSPACASVLGMAMANWPNVERRLRSILRSRQNRSAVSRRSACVSCVTALTLLGCLSVVHFQANSAEAAPPTAANSEEPAAPTAEPAKRLAELRARIAEQYVSPVDDKEIEQGAIKGMIGALRDPYSDYLTAEMIAEIERQIGGTLTGIGAQLEMHEKSIRIVTPLQDSPALKAGLQPNDVIQQIDGQSMEGISLPDAVKRIAGAQGTIVRLKVRRDGQVVEVAITRAPVKLPTVKGFRRAAGGRWNLLLSPSPKIGYLQFAQFGAQTPQELRDALESLKQQGMNGLILDLRYCPGGTLESAVEVAKAFLVGGAIVSVHSRKGEPITINANESAFVGDVPMIVLVNGQTASAAEVVAGALQDRGRAVVLGTRTFGKGSVQTLIKLEGGGGAIKLTTSHYRLPNGRNIDRTAGEKSWGINPNDGFFIPIDRAQSEKLLEHRNKRDLIGGKAADQANANVEVTAAWLEQQQSDPQLAAALKAMTSRLATGAFARISQFSPAEIEQFVKRQEIEQRRDAVLHTLQQFDRELADLAKEAAAKK